MTIMENTLLQSSAIVCGRWKSPVKTTVQNENRKKILTKQLAHGSYYTKQLIIPLKVFHFPCIMG